MTDATDSPAWRTDPTGRHAQRWFDGTTWTEHVADAHGTTTTDPYAPPAAPVEPVSGGPGGGDPTTVSPAAGAQSDPTTAYRAPEPSPEAGGAGWAAPAAEAQPAPEPQPWSQPAPQAEPPAQPAQGWGAPGAEQPAPGGWGAPAPQSPQPAPQPGPQPGGWPGAPQPAPPGQPAQGWGAAPPPVYGAAPQYGAPTYGSTSPTGAAGLNPVSAIVAAVGAVLVVIGLFALKWVHATGGGTANLSDIHNTVKHASDVTFLSKAFPAWGYIVALILGIGSAAAALFVKALKPIAIIVGVVMATWCLFFAFDIVHWIKKDQLASGGSVQIGAWLAAIGFLVAGIGAALPGKKG